LVAVAAAVIVLLTAGSAGSRLETGANDLAVRGAAGYLSLRARLDGSGRFLPVHLLSLASALASSAFWGAGLQVAWGTAPLLPDPLDLAPALAQLSMTPATDSVRHLALKSPGSPRVSVVPLWNQKAHLGEGWVAVWGAVPLGSESNRKRLVGLVVAGALVALAGAVRGWPRVRAAAGLGGTAGLALLGVLASRGIDRAGREATDLSLQRLRRLVEIAASSREVHVGDLPILLPGVSTRLLRPPFERRSDPPVARDSMGGEARAFVIASLRGGNGLEIGVRPLEADLGPYHGRIWLATLAGILGFLLAWWAPGRVLPLGWATGRPDGSGHFSG
jgi:hypothetical protein